MPKLRVLVADDEVLVRQGLCRLLRMEPDIEIVGEASNGEEALKEVLRLGPDVALMDIQMPIMNGVEATRRLATESPQTRVLVLTTFSDDVLVVQALQSGAHGYLLKDCGARQVAAAIRSVAMGQTAIGAEVTDKLLKHAGVAVASEPGPAKVGPSAKLTRRELEVLNLLSAGNSNREIAERLTITEKTVRDHVSNILAQLNLRDRTQAALWARENL